MPECPIDCPNRKPVDPTPGKAAAYVFALLVSIFLAFQCVSYERRNEETPVLIWMPCLLLIGTALGINIDPSAIASALGSQHR
ncbi:MAG TPA: hypothetical protein V6C78_14440 [Crinalium sp.]|jgi:hypothetical protein